ncbi:MAG: methyltransferase [Merdibacter sp.]
MPFTLPGLLGEEVLDLGCGYGVIGITLKKQYPDSAFTLAEVNPRALELAQENARATAQRSPACARMYIQVWKGILLLIS